MKGLIGNKNKCKTSSRRYSWSILFM